MGSARARAHIGFTIIYMYIQSYKSSRCAVYVLRTPYTYRTCIGIGRASATGPGGVLQPGGALAVPFCFVSATIVHTPCIVPRAQLRRESDRYDTMHESFFAAFSSSLAAAAVAASAVSTSRPS